MDMEIVHMKNFGVLLDDFGFMRDPRTRRRSYAVSSGAMLSSDSGEDVLGDPTRSSSSWLASPADTRPSCAPATTPPAATRARRGQRIKHRFCQGRVSGLTLSSIVALNGSPWPIWRVQIRLFRWDSSRHIKGGVRACAGRATNRSLTSPSHHSGNGTPHTYAASYA